jgi:copper chaperone CopZ
MKRRQFLAGLLLAAVAPAALAKGPESGSVVWAARVKGCLCAGCGAKFEARLQKVDGVSRASLDVATGKLTITAAAQVTREQLVAAIGETRFKLVELSDPTPEGT